MKVNKSLFIESIVPGNLYYFKEDRLTATHEPHFFVVVGIKEKEFIIFMAGTSNFEKASRRIELRKQNFSTLVRLKPDTNNELTKETYIDCNNYFDHTFDEFFDMFKNDEVTHKGYIEESKLYEIVTGSMASDNLEGEIQDIIKASIKSLG